MESPSYFKVDVTKKFKDRVLDHMAEVGIYKTQTQFIVAAITEKMIKDRIDFLKID